jgi:ubiquinone/menaquinone biosynthesis C-methylase UbiE
VTWELPPGSLERWPEDYDRGRPGWPDAAVEVAGLGPSSTVLDLGAGTGKLTRVLASAFRDVIAVEPQEAMLRVLRARCPGARALEGTADRIPLPESSVDAVFAAQAFHWFVGPQPLQEITRVLRPRGALVLMWNVPAGPWEPPIAAVESFLYRRAPDEAEAGYDPLDLSRRHASGEWRTAFQESPFGDIQEARFPMAQALDRQGLVAYFASMGWIADLPDPDRLALLGTVRSLLDADEYRRMWETHVYWTRLSEH